MTNFTNFQSSKAWFERTTQKVKETWTNVKIGFKENPELIAPFLTALTGLSAAGLGAVQKRKAIRKEETYVRDPCSGINLQLKRPMTSQEKLEYSRRVANRNEGETRADILDEMRLLK